jgi:hypothetical protein
MPLASFVKRTSLFAVAFGFAALGLATAPAAASPFSGLLNANHKPIITELGNKPIEGGHGPVMNPNHPPFHICPLYSPECKGPPIANPNPNQNPPMGGHWPIVINRPPVIVAAPPVVVAAPAPIIAPSQPVYAARPMQGQAPSPNANPNVASGEPCNCLTKQYQQDGSVVFRDLCTHEAAMATPADLQAQQQAAAQNPSQDQTQAPAR